MFMVAWADTARSVTHDVAPSFRRSLLNPRRLPSSTSMMIDHLYIPISSLPPPPTDVDQDISRIYYITADDIAELQSLASAGGRRRTTRGQERCKLGMVVDGRTRLAKDACELANYFGNVLSIPFGNESAEEIAAMQFHMAADVHGFLAKAATKEHFEGLIDWVEARRVEQTLARIYCNGKEEGPEFVVSGGMRFPVGKVEFGWGRPAFGSYYLPWGGDSGYVMPMQMPSSKWNGTGWCTGCWVYPTSAVDVVGDLYIG